MSFWGNCGRERSHFHPISQAPGEKKKKEEMFLLKDIYSVIFI